MKTIKYFIIAIALATTLGSVSVYAMDQGHESKEVAAAQTFTREQVKNANVCFWDAIYKVNIEDVHKALSCGADVNQVNGYQGTPLQWAACYGNAETVRILVAARAHLNQVHAANSYPPLHLAAHGCHIETVKILVFHGAILCGKEPEAMKKVIMQAQEARRTVGSQDWLANELLTSKALAEYLPQALHSIVGGYADPLAGVDDEQLLQLMKEQIIKNRTDTDQKEASDQQKRKAPMVHVGEPDQQSKRQKMVCVDEPE